MGGALSATVAVMAGGPLTVTGHEEEQGPPELAETSLTVGWALSATVAVTAGGPLTATGHEEEQGPTRAGLVITGELVDELVLTCPEGSLLTTVAVTAGGPLTVTDNMEEQGPTRSGLAITDAGTAAVGLTVVEELLGVGEGTTSSIVEMV